MKQLSICLVSAIILFISNTSAQPNLKVMEKSKYSVELIRYTIPENQWTAFENAYAQAGKLLSKSKYCLYYTINKGSEEPNHYVVIIHWTSEEDHLNGFRKSADFAPFLALVRPYYNQIQEMKHYTEIAAWQGTGNN